MTQENSYVTQAEELRTAIEMIDRRAPHQNLTVARARLEQLENLAQFEELSAPGRELVLALETALGTADATKAANAINDAFNELLEVNRNTVLWMKRLVRELKPEMGPDGEAGSAQIKDPAWMAKYPS